MKRDLKAPSLWQVLERDHSAEEVRSVVHAWLREAGEIMWQDCVLDRWQIFATQCCLALMKEVEPLAPGAEFTKQLVRKYQSLLGYQYLGRWVAEYLDAARSGRTVMHSSSTAVQLPTGNWKLGREKPA
ncbi:MAG: hypothetical protein ABI548_07080 [Polyangiaceae bacterium]